MAYVMSNVASGKILEVDTSKALQLPGVVDYIDHTDVPGQLLVIHNDTPIFAKDTVSSCSFCLAFRFLAGPGFLSLYRNGRPDRSGLLRATKK